MKSYSISGGAENEFNILKEMAAAEIKVPRPPALEQPLSSDRAYQGGIYAYGSARQAVSGPPGVGTGVGNLVFRLSPLRIDCREDVSGQGGLQSPGILYTHRGGVSLPLILKPKDGGAAREKM